MPEPPVYRPFALLALAAAVAGGVPLGIWMLAALHAGAPPVPVEEPALHASLQVALPAGTTAAGALPVLSGVLAWVAVASAAVNVFARLARRP